MNRPRGIDWIEERLEALSSAIARASVRGDGDLKHRLEVEYMQLLRPRRRLIVKEERTLGRFEQELARAHEHGMRHRIAGELGR